MVRLTLATKQLLEKCRTGKDVAMSVTTNTVLCDLAIANERVTI